MQHEKNLKEGLHEPIAIIGMNCQFPGVHQDVEDVNAFYDLLIRQQSVIKDVPENRWDIDKYYDPDRQKEDKIVSRKGGFLNNPRLFDAAFFKITGTEAKQMDPQQRLFLEVSIRALNHANIRLDSLKDSNTGVYCGISTHDYSQLNYKDKIKFNAYTYIGSADSAAAGRLCYFLNLKGPCLTVDTACSSSLSALYMATTALRSQQCDMAIVGGVHLSLCPEIFIGVTKANMLSALGQCSSFDASADGYARSEGCGVVIVKRLCDALKDHNTIHAVIKSIVMNQDGGGMGMAAPNLKAQIAMHQSVLEQAGLSASDIDYIEAHGTGTVVGDSVEFDAIKHVHQGHHSQEKPLIIGALKSNLGHTISSSGIASLIKVIGTLKNEAIPANLHYSTPNPQIDPQTIPVLFPVKTIPFTKNSHKKRYAQVSNFGFTGTNVSAVIEEPPHCAKETFSTDSVKPLCFVISAKSEYSLKRMMEKYLCYLQDPSLSAHDVCYTLINCRDHYKFRCAIIAKDKEALIKKIESKNYELKKVAVKKDSKIIGNEAQQIYENYLSGANIRLDKKEAQYNQVDLPLYCFDRKNYWHDDAPLAHALVPEDWCFQLEWQYQPPNQNNRQIKGSHWLLIGAKQLAFCLAEQGLSVILDEDNHSLDRLDGIIFAAGFDSVAPKDIDASIELQKKTLNQLLNLLNELNHKAIELQLIVLTTNAIAELAVSRLDLTSSMLPGFCKTLALELPQFKTILIDADKIAEANHAVQIMHEIKHNHGAYHEPMVAYRDGKRLVPRLKKAVLYDYKRSLQGNGRYLITGGCGGLGLVTAQSLLLAGAKELILVSRNTDKPLLKTEIKKIQSRHPNQVIRCVSLDITDKEKLRHLFVACNQDGLLKGIIHAAGASISAPLLEHQSADMDYLFSAKVQGGWYLHELSQDCALDFFIVYSSVSSVFGSNKESVYSATNSFLDALIAERRRLGLVGTAIQWGPWAEVGMAARRAHVGLKHALIHNEQGQALMSQLFNNPLAHITFISPEYLKFMLDFVPKPLPAFYQDLANDLGLNHTREEGLSTWLAAYLKTDSNKRLMACRSMLTELCRAILGVPETEDLDDEGGFFEIGFDSLMITEMATRLKEKLTPFLQVTATVGFEYPSITQLAQYIETELEHHLMERQAPQQPQSSDDDSIAIIGMSCSLPNAPDIAAFEWLLEQGLSGIQDIPIARWDNKNYYDPNPDAPGKSYVNKLGLIENIKGFDAHFFGISPREATLMDPQQRLFLENCYKALEHANYAPWSLRGSLTGVFAGVGSSHEYYSQLEKSGLSDDELGMFAVTGKALNIIPGRVAYIFDFKGPALSIDTACSSSLVAIHYACQSLKNREVDLALAGGVNVLLRPESIVNLCKAKALSADSQCKTFDERADGYVRAEGCGVLLLKRMVDALRDKDNILAVIKASAITNDGKSAGLTVPNGKSQEAVMMRALEQTKLASSDISYIETHGTGTPLGDPIEVHAINTVYGVQRGQETPLYLGAVKTNIGHLESAAGVAGVIKTIISLQKGMIYKNLNFNKLNPHIKIKDARIPVHNMIWTSNGRLKCAGVNAFGFSGTNAHIILQEFQARIRARENLPGKTNVLVLSAKSQRALLNLAKSYQQYLARTSDDFNDVCFTAATGRDHYIYRLVVAATSADQASQLLSAGDFSSSHGNNNLLALPHDKELSWLVADYLQGKKVDWVRYYTNQCYEFNKVVLPHYAFERSEFWSEKKHESDSMPDQSYEAILSHLYDIKWDMINANQLNNAKITDLWVISKNEIKTKKILGALRYQRVDDLSQLEDIANKNIVFLYQEGQFNTLVHCCQRLFQSLPARFILVTQDAYLINDQHLNQVNPYHTMASAFWKSFRNELEFSKNYTIDIDANSTLNEALNYLFNATTTQTQFAVRNGLYVPRLSKKKIPMDQKRGLFDKEASYLITGGTGGLAEPLIEYLIGNGVKHIILTSRSQCPMKTRTLIEHARKKQVCIKHYCADASQFLAMEHIIKEIEQSAKPLKGVFHLAGVIQDELVVNLDEKGIQYVLNAKMESASHLHQLTKNLQLDLFVLFSSSASILGSRGQANYAAANGFLDGLAQLRRQQGLPSIAINWGAFNCIGMTEKNMMSLQRRGFIPLTKENMEVLDLLLSSQLPQVLLCPMDWDVYFKNTPNYINLSDQVNNTSPADPLFLSFLQQHSNKERVIILSQALCDITADVLGLDNAEHVGEKTDLFSMGMDSLTSLELRNRIHDKLRCPALSLPIEYFINEPRIDKIARNIANELTLIFEKTRHVVAGQEATEELALSDTQYVFWLIRKLGTSFNCGMQLQLHGKLNKNYLSQAMDFAIKQNSVFWIDFRDDIPVQRLKKQGQFKLIYEDISTIYDSKLLSEVFYDNIMQTIPFTEQPLIRIYLYKLNDELHELHIMIPHIILDDSSYRTLFDQFRNNYECLLLGKSLVPVPEKHTYFDFVKQNNVHYEQDLQDKVDFWRAYNTGFRRLSFGRAHHLPDSSNQAKNLFHYPMDARLIERFKRWHQEKNINVSTGLIAACQIVFYQLSRQKKIPITILHSGREGSHFKSVIGLFTEYKMINITLNKKYKFIELLKSIEEELLKTAPYQKCSQSIKATGLKDLRLSIIQYVIYMYNTLFLTKHFKKTRLNSITIDYYLRILSIYLWRRSKYRIKYNLNKLLNLNLRLQKPARLRVLINITASFFIKEPRNMKFADLDTSIPYHYGSVDRPISNQSLWLYFTKDQYNEYRLSINGPLTTYCKNQIAQGLNQVITMLLENEELSMSDLIGE